MKNLFFYIVLLCLGSTNAFSQRNPITIPPVLSGTNISLMLQNGTKSFYNGFNTSTIGYNGNYLGPTIVLDKGQAVTMEVMNMLGDTTTTHWHGLHVSPSNDGGPHNLIMDGATWTPNFTVMDNAATYWYHPHLHGKTMKQVIKGAAGFIIVRDSTEARLALPRDYGVDDIPLAFQFQTFNPTTKQLVMDDELDNAVLVNGVVSNASVEVPAQMVRLRLLNTSSHRFFMFGFDDNRTFYQITSDAGLLNVPVPLTRLQLGSGERAEILVNFSGQVGRSFFLKQFGTQLPAGYPGGPQDNMGMMQLGPLDNINFNLLEFVVTPANNNAITGVPTSLVTNAVLSQTGAGQRSIRMTGSPAMSMTNFLMNGVRYNEQVINFRTVQENIEVWNLTNQSMMPHPFHIHGNHFYVVSVNGAAPPANLRGRKDVVTVPPNNGSVKLITQYRDFSDSQMPYMYHCHILSHEDNGMMGQFIVEPLISGMPEINEALSFELFPNPALAGGRISLRALEEIHTISIMDGLGRVISKSSVYSKEFEVAMPETKGLYFINVQTEKSSVTKKIILH